MAKEPALTPRARFMQTRENIVQHNRILDNPQFRASADTALQEHTRAVVSLANSQDLAGAGAQQAAAASFHMISGAHQFMEVFERLTQPYEQPAPPNKIESLQHQ